jgi:glycosyltransferase involved in cell wall biosynthesis
MTLYADPFFKTFIRFIYVITQAIHVFANIFVPRSQGLALYYGGARAGDLGGPLVKVRLLQKFFPEVRWGFNVVYTLSNTPYLPSFALNVLKLLGIPVIHNQNGVFYQGWFQGDWQAMNRKMAIAYHAADWVFYQSEFCRVAANLFLGPRSGPGEILFNAVDTNYYCPRSDWPFLRNDHFTFLLTGKISNYLYYRLESSILGLKTASDFGLQARLLVAGWIESEAKCRAESLVNQLGIGHYVSFTGFYSQEQAPHVYRKADAYIMLKHNDPCPNSVLEAMATGLPILYSDSGGVPELVGPNAGISLPCQRGWDKPYVPSSIDIGFGMQLISERYTSLAKAARFRAVDNFDVAHWIARHREVFTNLRTKVQ